MMNANANPVVDLSTQLSAELAAKTMPAGALGELIPLAHRIGMILNTVRPEILEPSMIVFVADHGIAKSGVSAFPQEVTWQMVSNFLHGGAAVSVFARCHGFALQIVDCGVAHEFEPRLKALSSFSDRKIALGTADCSLGQAMSSEQCLAAIQIGRDLIRQQNGNTLMFGEMGIGNTSIASLLTAILTKQPIEVVVGRGTGVDDAGLARKINVLKRSLVAHSALLVAPSLTPSETFELDPHRLLCAVGGFEIAAMVGAFLEAKASGKLVIVDGFIVTAALLVAQRIDPRVVDQCVFAHESEEPGHRFALAHFEARTVLRMGLRLGEGTGAALALPMVRAAAAMLRDMATFESAAVAGKSA
jgi:nicotinate-nucleotide--dimethylbenzimidazole phosphoribosyltransferase